MEWKTIESAPRDGTLVIGLGDEGAEKTNAIEHYRKQYGYDVRVMKWWPSSWSARNNYGEFTVGFTPVAWMPLPPSPAEGGE